VFVPGSGDQDVAVRFGRHRFRGAAEAAEVDVDVAPRPLAKSGDLPSRTDASGVTQPLTASYQVRISLDAGDRTILLGAPGRVRIHCPAESILARARRWLRGSFHFSI